MDTIRRLFRPELRRPRAVVAFEGWNDASEAASGAAAYLLDLFDAGDPFALIESEEFFDFQVHRPLVEIEDGITRRLSWPATRIYAVPLAARPHDLVVVVGDEPNLRWKTYARELVRALSESDVEEVVLLGAYLGDSTHAEPVPIAAAASDLGMLARTGLPVADYEGPTGIVGVIGEACREAGLPSVALWANTPHYLAANANPAAMLALIRATETVVGMPVDTSELEQETSEFLERVDDALSQIDPASATRTPSTLVSEIEQFLREQR
jgi:predicted ATP-grasp superfamily ATP-dependent carboligase